MLLDHLWIWIITNVIREGTKKHNSAQFHTKITELFFKYTTGMLCQKIHCRIFNEGVSQVFINLWRKCLPKLLLFNSHSLTEDPKHDQKEITNNHLLLNFLKPSGEQNNILVTKYSKTPCTGLTYTSVHSSNL